MGIDNHGEIEQVSNSRRRTSGDSDRQVDSDVDDYYHSDTDEESSHQLAEYLPLVEAQTMGALPICLRHSR